MKKRLLALLFVGILALTGCQNKEQAKLEALQAAFENIGMEHSAVIMNVLSKEWEEAEGEAVYVFTKEGTGNISGETFTYSCGFDEDNKIALKIVIFKEDGSMLIKGSLSETEGTFSVVEWKEDGSLLFTLVFGSDTMEFNFEMLDDGNTMKLCRPGTDVIHTWIKK